jgi:hypothetical protein
MSAALHHQATETSVIKPNHAARDVALGALALLVAATICVYGFIKIVPLALAHVDAPQTDTKASPDGARQ